MEIIKKYYNKNIQTDMLVIQDVCNEIKKNPNMKMLVFGLGYDSELWYNLTDKNTFFVEDKIEYIDLNKNININNIIQFIYPIKVIDSFDISESNILEFKPPKALLDQAPFDIIIVDGPCGYALDSPGRLLPIFWSKTYLSKKGSIIYIDDYYRQLENHCVNKYFSNQNYTLSILNVRMGCGKINVIG